MFSMYSYYLMTLLYTVLHYTVIQCTLPYFPVFLNIFSITLFDLCFILLYDINKEKSILRM